MPSPNGGAACGNKQRDASEQCDGTEGCGDNCVCMAGWRPTSSGCTRCGNAVVDAGELCDGTVGCNATSCQCEREWTWSNASSTCTRCGNMRVDDWREECDDPSAACVACNSAMPCEGLAEDGCTGNAACQWCASAGSCVPRELGGTCARCSDLATSPEECASRAGCSWCATRATCLDAGKGGSCEACSALGIDHVLVVPDGGAMPGGGGARDVCEDHGGECRWCGARSQCVGRDDPCPGCAGRPRGACAGECQWCAATLACADASAAGAGECSCSARAAGGDCERSAGCRSCAALSSCVAKAATCPSSRSFTSADDCASRGFAWCSATQLCLPGGQQCVGCANMSSLLCGAYASCRLCGAKAYAKLHGSYEAIESGAEATALTNLTGALLITYRVAPSKTDIDDLFRKLEAHDKVDHVMCCNINGERSMAAEKRLGLVTKHSYALLQAVQVPLGGSCIERLVQLRNPWGNTEWSGAWSNSNPRWTPQLHQQLGDFAAHFGNIIVLLVKNRYQCRTVWAQLRSQREGFSHDARVHAEELFSCEAALGAGRYLLVVEAHPDYPLTSIVVGMYGDFADAQITPMGSVQKGAYDFVEVNPQK
eukprot:m51a1_g10478 putative calpain family cysteine protease (599) ;mRNA; r:19616-35395